MQKKTCGEDVGEFGVKISAQLLILNYKGNGSKCENSWILKSRELESSSVSVEET